MGETCCVSFEIRNRGVEKSFWFMPGKNSIMAAIFLIRQVVERYREKKECKRYISILRRHMIRSSECSLLGFREKVRFPHNK